MSIDLHEEKEGRVLTVLLSGKLRAEDYAHLVPTITQAIQKHGKVRMLVDMRDFHGWTLGALWEDFKFDARHFNHIERLAMVGDRKWEQWMATFCRPFTTAKIQYFPQEQAAQARAWLDADEAPSAAPPAPRA